MRTAAVIVLFLLSVHLVSSLLIGAFNVQTFGNKKASNATLLEYISTIVHRYDIVLIQEVRDNDLSATNRLMQQVNKGSSPYTYDHIVSEPLGRTTYKERYLFIYRNEKVSVVKNFTYDDGCEPCGTDTFIREPFVVMFSSKYSAVQNFVLIPQHTSPDFAVKEVDALHDVVVFTREHWNTNDILLLGDFNAGCNYIKAKDWPNIQLYTDKSYHWLIPDTADTTVSHTTCPYDRIVSTDDMMRGVASDTAQVYDFMADLGLSHSWALAVSDHFPVEVQLT
ncbi:deoxyribonuclease-1 [Astyanax mexicanus]|uniref:deoxyribonuclease-1 n=1 Tax=Astyanax mexicanus TaxID=7994 RepID=UPI0020CB4F37|nr:deoxyribonuclease-1 [Astyanax mexicanus]XP_022531610.2 deoxyribonuclease-1 [Astyanax mexicanus]